MTLENYLVVLSFLSLTIHQKLFTVPKISAQISIIMRIYNSLKEPCWKKWKVLVFHTFIHDSFCSSMVFKIFVVFTLLEVEKFAFWSFVLGRLDYIKVTCDLNYNTMRRLRLLRSVFLLLWLVTKNMIK